MEDQSWRKQNEYYSNTGEHYFCPDCPFLDKYSVPRKEGNTAFTFFGCSKAKGQLTILDSTTTIEMKKNHISEKFSVERSRECYEELKRKL